MAYLELNALSTILCGSFSAKIYLPEMNMLDLDDEKHEKKYPVLWLLHSEGGTSLDWNRTMAENCAAEYGIFIIAPDAQHSICTNMDYGPKYEEFLASELPGICRNNLPISEDPALNWIGDVYKRQVQHQGSIHPHRKRGNLYLRHAYQPVRKRKYFQ